MGEPVWLTPAQFADRLGIKRATVYVWIGRHKIAAAKASRRMVRIPESEVDRIMGRLVPAKPEPSPQSLS